MTRTPFRRMTAGATVLLAVAIVFAPAANAADADTTETIPDLPDLQEVDGSAGSLLNRNLGTGDQAFCADIGQRLSELAGQWAEANEAAARETANQLRYLFANANAANVQCLTAAGAALTSSGTGSVTGSLTLPLPGS
ncbi:hypothetical protein [Corynebacterium glyciniphilum]|uniref:hypothetical protein n=1 Tax=Corynebacterium glyciniphilum TaxID=1404244 RepID=UPI0011AB6246|nr:hypothetical protein [Corynebacterium glyciniphilum]